MGDSCCGCTMRDDCDDPKKKEEPTESCICPECKCDPCECEDEDSEEGDDK